MKKTFSMLSAILITVSIYSQQLTATIYNPSVPFIENGQDWATDYLVSNTEPFGQPSAVYRTTNNTIYVSVPDTNIVSGRAVVILRSTNNGINWTTHASISPAFVCPKTKMVARPGSDSVYCFFLYGTSVYSWNVINNNFNLFTAHPDLRDFDVTVSSTGSLYLIVDYRVSNQVYWMGSTNGGITWGSQVFMSSSAARPRMTMSSTGDTALINYYGPPVADTPTSAVRFVRYRETVPGTLTTIVGTFTTIINAGVAKDQVQGVRHGMNSWLLFTTGTAGSYDLNSIVSTDGGTTYGSPVTIGSLPGRDEYWFDAKYFNLGTGGIDIIYYSDTAQSGPPTVTSDRMCHTYANNSTPSAFVTPVIFSQTPPVFSARGYIPTVFEYFDAGGDVGAIWVGVSGGNSKLYFDRLNAVVGVHNNGNELPNAYRLSQNYPNPFNPTTKINFAIPVSGNVTIKVFDIIGRETAAILNKDMKAGSYTVDFDASKLSSGVYFYKILSGSYIETKKMILIK